MLFPTRCITALIALLIPCSVEAASVGVCGGGGGSQSTTLSCPTGQYIVGVSVRFDAYVDRIGIRCAAVDQSGHRGTLGAFQFAGGTGGSFVQSKTCSGNRAMIEILTKAGVYVDSTQEYDCETRKPQGGFDVAPGKRPSEQLLVASGGHGGQLCELACSPGEALNKLIVRYGSWIDSIEAFCRP